MLSILVFLGLLAAVAPFTQAQQYLYECEPDCLRTEFCGVDRTCHTWSCDNFYQYGDTDYTAYDESVNLICQDEAAPVDLFDYGVIYGCRGYSNTEPPPGQGITQGFTRYCEANLASNLAFECYQMAQDTDFEPFLSIVNTSGVDCVSDYVFENGTTIQAGPGYIYQVIYGYQNESTGSVVFNGPDGRFDPFNRSMAMVTMNSKLTITKETSSPTASPTVQDAMPTDVPMSTSPATHYSQWLGAVLTTLFISWISI